MPDFNPIELEAYVRQRAPEIARDIRTVAEKSRNEADLVAETEKVLEKFAKNFDVQLHLERERTLINGRADAVYNRFVIEYEPPRSLGKSNSHRNNKHAIEQVQQYIEGLERLDRHKKERMAGVALDGGYFIFARYRDEHWHIDDPLPVNTNSTETFLRYLLSLSTELALTPENLLRDFGENSNTARQVVPALYHAIDLTNNKKAQVLFQQWQRQFREVSGYNPESGQLDPAELGRLYAVKDKHPDLEKLFFAIHTYYATFIKLLALQVVHFYLIPKMGTELASAASYDNEKLRSYLNEMERGGLFAQLGIHNFLEGDFFGWYLDIWSDTLHTALQRLMGDLANYSLVTLDVDPEETRDLLKQLYQNLMPKKLRHALGEYYTPDWLAERLLNQLGYDGDPSKRILDPSCGSGTFPVLALKRARKYADDKMLPPGQVLEQLLNNIVGFDLNPLAVISARTNYLLALGDLIQHRMGEISIPIYLADSILTPSQGADLFTQGTYSFTTAVGRFSIPSSLVQAQYINQLADLLEECVHVGLSPDRFRQRLLKTFPLDIQNDEAEINIVVNLYSQLFKLEEQGINGIWARIIKNAFAPLFQRKFDYIAGNPPWINWESLPQDYRQETKPLWIYHGLFPHGGIDTILGKGKKDLSMLMTYVSLDKYLRDGAKLGFVITQSVFKTTGAGQGFRRFLLGDSTPVCVLSVDDMAEIKPFEGAANRTAIVILEKNRRTQYPMKSYLLWYKPDGGATIPEDITLNELVKKKVATYRQFYAKPVDRNDITSAWITGRPRALNAVQKILGPSKYTAHAGAYTGGANAVYWLDIVSKRPDGLLIVSNITEGAKRKVDAVQAALEPELIYPLLRDRDLDRWKAEPSAYILVAQDPQKRQGIDENIMQYKYPKTYSYLKSFEKVLLQRKDRGTKGLIDKGAPFYSMFSVSDYTFSPYKVVWSNIASKLDCAVISELDGKSIVPQHIVTLIAFDNLDEAHFACAVMNSSPVDYALQSYAEKGGKSFGTPHVLENINIPLYDPMQEAHKALAALSNQAHEATRSGDKGRVREISAEIDELAGQLWGLTNEELKEIQESLEELK